MRSFHRLLAAWAALLGPLASGVHATPAGALEIEVIWYAEQPNIVTGGVFGFLAGSLGVYDVPVGGGIFPVTVPLGATASDFNQASWNGDYAFSANPGGWAFQFAGQFAGIFVGPGLLRSDLRACPIASDPSLLCYVELAPPLPGYISVGRASLAHYYDGDYQGGGIPGNVWFDFVQVGEPPGGALALATLAAVALRRRRLERRKA